MKFRRQQLLTTETLVAYLEGEVTRSQAATIEADLADSTDARRRLDSLLRIRDVLSEPMRELEGVDLVPQLREAIAHPTVCPPRRFSRLSSWYVPSGLVAAAAGIALLIGAYNSNQAPIPRSGPAAPAGPQEFRLKGEGEQSRRRESWAGVQAYRLPKGGKPERLDSGLSANDGLLFSYNNLGQEPYRYLMVFGVDAKGEVRWYVPAYERPGTNPASLAIRLGVAQEPLPEVAYHDYALGPLCIYALFTDHPLHVLEVEGMLKERRSGTSMPALPQSAQQVFTTQVVFPE